MHVSIRIKGHLDLSWQDYLEGLEIVYEADGTSRLPACSRISQHSMECSK
jgi:hypothetical protein